MHVSVSLSFQISRRNLFVTAATTPWTILSSPVIAASSSATVPVNASSLAALRGMIKQAKDQLDPAVPLLIEKEQWDSIRAILITPPLSDIFKKPAVLQDYANVVGEFLPNGDELGVLQAREELQTHLRFLDMAVYNNVFNPIKSVGENGATKQLVASYYEDPMREYKASVKALEELYELGE
jgi:hypothetical protein